LSNQADFPLSVGGGILYPNYTSYIFVDFFLLNLVSIYYWRVLMVEKFKRFSFFHFERVAIVYFKDNQFNNGNSPFQL